jgi:hypothetical protein
MNRNSRIAAFAGGGAVPARAGYLAGHLRQSSVPEPAVQAAQPVPPNEESCTGTTR